MLFGVRVGVVVAVIVVGSGGGVFAYAIGVVGSGGFSVVVVVSALLVLVVPHRPHNPGSFIVSSIGSKLVSLDADCWRRGSVSLFSGCLPARSMRSRLGWVGSGLWGVFWWLIWVE